MVDGVVVHPSITRQTMDINEIFGGVKKKNGESFSSDYYKKTSPSPTASSSSYKKTEDTHDEDSPSVYESDNSQVKSQIGGSSDNIEHAVKRFISSEFKVPVEKLYSYTVLNAEVTDNIPMLCWKIEQSLGVNLTGMEKELRTVGDLIYTIKKRNPYIICDYNK